VITLAVPIILFFREQEVFDRVKFLEGDILYSRKLELRLKEVDIVYHLAAKVTSNFSDQSSHVFEQVNHWGTAELTYAIERSNHSRLIYVSSTSVYGSSKLSLREDNVFRLDTVYGVSKLRGEKHVERLFGSIEKCYIIRCANVFGYSQNMRMDGLSIGLYFMRILKVKSL